MSRTTSRPASSSRVMRAYTECRFGQLHYRYAAPPGPTGRPPLVMLHQNPSSSAEYLPLIERMAETRTVVAFDTPGNGMSDIPSGPQPLDQYAGAFADGIEALGLAERGPVDLFGYHSGTYLCCELAISRPDLVRRVVLSGVPMRIAEERAANLAKAEAIGLPDEDGEEFFAWLRWLWDFTVKDRRDGVPMETAMATFADKASALHRRAWVYIGIWSYDAETRLPMVLQPVLVAQPHEPLLEQSRAASKLFPNAIFQDLPELDRDVFVVGTDVFAQAIRSFLT